MMKWSILFLLTGLWSGLLAQAQEMPQVGYYPDLPNERPHWVAAEEALGEDGRWDPTYFDEGVRSRLRRLLSREPRGSDGCIEKRNEIPGLRADAIKNLELLSQREGWIFLAEVTGLTAGFQGGEPGTLIRIEPRQILKGPSDRLYPHYVFFPVGTVPVGNKSLCVTDLRYPELAKVGESMLLFVPMISANQGEFLFGADSMAITFPDGGGASLPLRYRESDSDKSGTSVEELVTFTAAAVRDASHEQ